MAEDITGETLLEKGVEGRPDSAAAADHPDVGRQGLMLKNLPEALEIVSMPSSDEEHMAPEMELSGGERVREVYSSHLVGFGESLSGRELGPIVQNSDPQTKEGSQCAERLGQMAGSDNDHLGRRVMKLEVDLSFPSTRQRKGVESRKNLGAPGHTLSGQRHCGGVRRRVQKRAEALVTPQE